MKPVIQYRWKLEKHSDPPRLFYYGLRNYPNHTRRVVPVASRTVEVLERLDGVRSLEDVLAGAGDEVRAQLQALVAEGAVVDAACRRQPTDAGRHRTCVRCVNNDWVLAGLEFDDRGVCAFCQCLDKVPDTKSSYMVGGDTISEEELRERLAGNRGRFDALVLYTGGKDSSFLLWYLARKLGVRALACTWNLPFASETSRRNMEAARRCLPEVEFVERTVAWDDMKRTMRTLVAQYGIPCICPFISYALFYPLAVLEGIPLIMDGIEASQTALAKATAPLTATESGAQMSERDLTLAYFRNLALPPGGKPKTYIDEFVATLRSELPKAFDPVRAIVEGADRWELPVIKRLETDKLYKRWGDVAELLARELDWQMPPGQVGLLHTSCSIENVKDFVQYRGFGDMTRPFFPMSMIELSSAVGFGHLSRDEGIVEMAERGYRDQEPAVTEMLRILGFTRADLPTMHPDVQRMFERCEFPEG